MVCEYQYCDGFTVTDEMVEAYKEHGYIIIRGLLDKDEVGLVLKTLEGPDGMLKHAYTTNEADGRVIQRILFPNPGTDVTGIIARSEKVAGSAAKLLEGEVYHYHSKFIMKDPKQGGESVWHQDYGYWYNYGCLFPQLTSCFIAIDPCKSDNGGLQVIPGSNKLGRLTHTPAGNLQTGADPERLKEVMKVLPAINADLDSGDALFIHCNILHLAPPNTSDKRRWAYICCFNRKTNNPMENNPHAFYSKLDIVPNDSIKKCTNFRDFTGKDFRNPPAEKSKAWPKTSAEMTKA